MIAPFSIAKLPRVEFGSGSFDKLPGIITRYGKHVLVVLGSGSFLQTAHWARLNDNLKEKGCTVWHCNIKGEPSPLLIDELVELHKGDDIDVVVGIGGGSPLDAAKSIAGLLKVGRTVMDYLEGVGLELPYTGPAVPLIAVPTTAGTGSEATKNAVLSIQGVKGFKKSFRDDKLVAKYAVIDPDLLATCPRDLIAANGMDALTQLMESYVSTRSNRWCDALNIDGIRAARDALLPWYDHADDPGVTAGYREKMAYAAWLSGVNLAQTGLGSVHGLASPLGAFYPVPHGVVCGTLVAECARTNIEVMRAREPDNLALAKYARLAEVVCERRIRNPQDAWTALVDTLTSWTEHMQLPRLGEYGVSQDGIEQIVAASRGSSMQTNPVVLTDEEIAGIVRTRL
jgi:alcohol dehydrogenase class IV